MVTKNSPSCTRQAILGYQNFALSECVFELSADEQLVTQLELCEECRIRISHPLEVRVPRINVGLG